MSFSYTASGNIVFGSSSFAVSSYYAYSGSGKLYAANCGNNIVYVPKKLVTVAFKAGQRAWLKHKAQKGKIESVMVKKVKILSDLSTLGGINVMYFDNLNAVFNETDLINQSEAISIALAYYQSRIFAARKAMECA